MRHVHTQDEFAESPHVEVAEAQASPPTKRRRFTKTGRAEQTKYLCLTCAIERVGTQFPDYNPSDDCEHLINTCTRCLRKWVEVQIDGATFVVRYARDKDEIAGLGIKCPHPRCEAVMKTVDVEAGATKKVFLRFLEMERKHIAENTPNWRWCLAPGCTAGQVHHRPTSDENEQSSSQTKRPFLGGLWLRDNRHSAAAELEKSGLICTCRLCGARACTDCDRPWHEGETCEQYQYRVKDRQEEEDKSLRTISKVTKKCPGCGKPVQKNGGCPVMYCPLCNVRYCWTCVEVMSNGKCACGRR